MKVFAIALVVLFMGCALVSGMDTEAGVDDSIIALLGEDESRELGDSDSEGSLEGSSMGMDESAEFESFIHRHGKKYKDGLEHRARFGVWKENLGYVRKWNADSSRSFQLGMNEFSDLSDDEFAASYLNSGLHEEYKNSETFRGLEESLIQTGAGAGVESEAQAGFYDIRWHKNTGKAPDTADWTKVGAISAVNNQAKCFACYAFASTGAIEAALVIQGKPLVKLSAQQVVDCSTPSSGFMNHGCKGGTMVKSYKYIIKNGLMKWTDYGYRTDLNSRPECKLMYARCKYKKEKVVQRISGYVNIRKGSEKDLMNAVGMRPVAAAIDAHHRPFKLYRSGVFSLDACTTHLTHGLLVVGYGKESGKKYWKVKNSWGTSWGQNGFGKVVRDQNMCAIGNWANYPIVPHDHVHTVSSLSELGDNPF
jgi:C1A family cysteine protease